jgi:hypothetical protein
VHHVDRKAKLAFSAMLITALLAAATASAKTLTLRCGELNGVRYGYNNAGRVSQGQDGFQGGHPTIIWDESTHTATISMSDAAGRLQSSKAAVVNEGPGFVAWLIAQPDATELWTYHSADHALVYSEQVPRWLLPGAGTAGTVFITTCEATNS